MTEGCVVIRAGALGANVGSVGMAKGLSGGGEIGMNWLGLGDKLVGLGEGRRRREDIGGAGTMTRGFGSCRAAENEMLVADLRRPALETVWAEKAAMSNNTRRGSPKNAHRLLLQRTFTCRRRAVSPAHVLLIMGCGQQHGQHERKKY